jgi:hypothetical protein
MITYKRHIASVGHPTAMHKSHTFSKFYFNLINIPILPVSTGALYACRKMEEAATSTHESSQVRNSQMTFESTPMKRSLKQMS